MHRSARITTCLAVAAFLVPACSGGGDDTASGAASASGTTTLTSGTGPTGTATAATDSSGGTDSAGSASATGTSTSSTTSTSDATSTSGPPKFDLGAFPDAGNPGCGGGGGGGGNDPEFSYIWIANSSQGTVSKIDTQTMQELGRYVVRPDGGGSPSRTSVSLSGNVAVASRLGGITKIYARVEDCKESNGMPGIQTATDANYLPWGVEECIAWHTPFNVPSPTQRPVAWAPGTLNPQTCEYENEMVWTAIGSNNVSNSLVVYRLNGDDGSIDATIPMPDVPIGYFGAYGGAVNADGDFWFVNYDGNPRYMVRVDYDDLTYEKVPVPTNIRPYGFTVDSKGRPWIGSFVDKSARYDPVTQTWDQFPALGYGIQEDAQGRMWMADYGLPGVREIDSDTLTLGVQVPLPASTPKGVSIDFYGKVWVVDMGKSAFRVDPDTLTFDVFDQLVGPYTYSDMTGWGLSNVTFPPG
ncbi:MAG: hypothetical protein D6705_12175 [Deltaproteobacteria bacterium]|nr:MAG: hypothetical protein D6705_12175 [Deltaproteobacteria bacterium]